MILLKAMRRMTVAGLPVVIENPVGSTRTWSDPFSGDQGRTTFTSAYGYIPGVPGMDNEGLDVFVGPVAHPQEVYVITQRKGPEFTQSDEHKVMLGYASPTDAKRAYLAHYTDDRFLGRLYRLPIAEFRRRVQQMRKRKTRADAVFGG